MKYQKVEVADTVPDPSYNFIKNAHTTIATAPVEDSQRRSWLQKRPWSRRKPPLGEHPNDEPHPDWKPLSISAPILGVIIFVTLLLIAAIEAITQRALAQGGLALSPSPDEIPTYAMFSYLYAPTVIAVLYSLVWSWVDLDVKRMQPWFELSKPGGAKAEDSLFLDYPYDFIAYVPIKAAKKKHWPAFFSGTTMIVVFWLITPLQTAILGTGVVSLTESVVINHRSQLVPLSEQTARLNPEINVEAYAIKWLGKPLPPFTALDYTTLPFYIENDTASTQPDTNWTVSTTKLSTELECWPAKLNHSLDTLVLYSNGQGCDVAHAFPYEYMMEYFGYYRSEAGDALDPIGDVTKHSTCPPTANSTHQFLALWGKRPDTDLVSDAEITALYCQPHYYKQEVVVTIDAASLKPWGSEVEPLSPRETLSVDEFNSTAFEYLLANGIDPNPIMRDYPFNNVIEQHGKVGDLIPAVLDVSNAVGLALAGQNRSLDAYSDPELLQQIYSDVHQFMFSVAVSRLLQNETLSNHTASSTYSRHGILVSRVFSAVVEGLLALVAVFTAVLLFLCRKSRTNLNSNPSSIGRLVDVFRSSPDLVDSFHSMGAANGEHLVNAFRHEYFQLRPNDTGSCAEPCISRVVKDSPDGGEQRAESQIGGHFDPIRPLVLRRRVGAAFTIALLSAVAGLVYLKQQEVEKKGLARPTENFELLQLLENYLPTVFATIIEPFWVLLNRLLCVLQPFKDLSAGNAKPARSIEATYTAVPPPLAFMRALRSKHFILMLICAVSLLANLLAVSLGALFNEEQTLASYPQSFKPSVAARFNNDTVFDFTSHILKYQAQASYEDHMYVAMANISLGAPLPPWISSEFFFQPFQLADDEALKASDRYQIQTRGFGVNANCTDVAEFEMPVFANYSSEPPSPHDPYPDDPECPNIVNSAIYQLRSSVRGQARGLSAVEYCSNSDWGVNFSDNSPCDKGLTMAWGRTAHAEDQEAALNASLAICRPVFETAMFNVTIDSKGYVLSYARASPLVSTLGYAESDVHTDTLIARASDLLDREVPTWHNDTLSGDWMNYLLTISTGSRSALDLSQPPPNTKVLVPFIEEIYRVLFAIMLGINQDVFEPGDSSTYITGTRFVTETKIFMNGPAFVLTMIVLGLNVVAALIFYAKAVVFVLPRMPTTIGSVLAYVAPSRLMMSREQASTYSFGRYAGGDGELHVGIEMDPHSETGMDPYLISGSS